MRKRLVFSTASVRQTVEYKVAWWLAFGEKRRFRG